MNIIEAIKSGKLHKRKINREWCHAPSGTNEFILAYSIDDILANDWMVEEARVTITETDFANAVLETCKKHYYVPGEHPADITRWVCLLKQELFKELGL